MLSSPISYLADKLLSPSSSTTYLILLVTIVVIALHFIVTFVAYPATSKFRRHGRPKLPPLAAPSWPLVGSLFSLVDDKGNLPYEILAQMVRDHGPVFRFDFGSFPTIIISDAAIVHDAFAKSAAFADRPRYPMFFNYGQGIIANTNNGVLRTNRRFYLTALRALMGKGKTHLEDLVVKEIQHLIARFDTRYQEPFDPYDDLAQTSANILCSVLFGKHYTLDDVIFKEVLENLKECYELAGHENERNFIPLLSYLPATKKARRAKEVYRKLTELFRAFIGDAIKDHVPNSPKSYLDMYCDHFFHGNDGNDNKDDRDWKICYKDDINLETTIGDLMAGGTETSASVASWGLLLLAMHPEVQARIQRDIKELDTTHPPEYQDRSRLPYVQAVIMEIQRVGSVTPLGVPHCVSSSTTLGGYDIPKDTAVMVNFWWIHNDPSEWDEPHLFKPERFLAEDASLIRRDNMMPFSVGRRRCIGEDLAVMELFLLFTHLLHRFTLHLIPSSTTASLAAKQGVTRLPCPYKIYVTPREG